MLGFVVAGRDEAGYFWSAGTTTTGRRPRFGFVRLLDVIVGNNGHGFGHEAKTPRPAGAATIYASLKLHRHRRWRTVRSNSFPLPRGRWRLHAGSHFGGRWRPSSANNPGKVAPVAAAGANNITGIIFGRFPSFPTIFLRQAPAFAGNRVASFAFFGQPHSLAVGTNALIRRNAKIAISQAIADGT